MKAEDLEKLAYDAAIDIAMNLAYLDDMECQDHDEAVEAIKDKIVRVFSIG